MAHTDEPLRDSLQALPIERFIPMRLNYRVPRGGVAESPERVWR